MLIKKITIVNLIILLLIGIDFGFQQQVSAQSTWEDNSWEDDQNQDDGLGEFDDSGDAEADSFGADAEADAETDVGADESSFLGGKTDSESDYIDEDLIPEGAERDLELSLLRQKTLLLEEKVNAPLNVAYGAGTGLMIGGWLALLGAPNARDTLRSIGLGVVTGGIIGAVIGTRSVWDPQAPRPPVGEEQPEQGAMIIPEKSGITVAFQLKF